MRRPVAILLLGAMLASACGVPSEGAEFGEDDRPALVAGREAVCQAFIDATVPLGEPGIGYVDYQQTLTAAARPLIDWATGSEQAGEDQAVLATLERIYAGDATRDELWVIEELGGVLAAGGGSICEELGRNVAYMPPPTGSWDAPPDVDVVSAYTPGTADHACDVFIQTVDIWVDDASVGAEYGPDMADQVDELIAALETLGIDAGVEALAVVSEKWRTLPWVRGNEEGGQPLMDAAGELASVATRCGELFQALRFDPEPAAPPPDYSGRVREVAAVLEFDPGQNCGTARVPGGVPIPPTPPLDDDARQAVEALLALGPEGGSFVNGYEYRVFSRTSDELVLLGTSPGGGLSDAYFRWVDGRWKPQTFGSCHWRATGFDVADWQLYPDFELLDRRSSVIELLAVDYCGVVFEDGHEVVAEVDYSEGTVEIVVWEAINPPAGTVGYSDLSCRLGATFRLSVTLPGPLGDRELVGAAESLAP